VTVKRRRAGGGHAYYVDGEHYPGVTTIIGKTIPKGGLIDWASRTTANYALDFWDELAELLPSARLERLLKAKNDDRDTAGRRGTEVHKIAVRLIAGEEVDKPEELAGHIDSYVDFLDRIEPEAVHTELWVASRTVRYCGTADLVADLPALKWEFETIPPARWLLDVKTSRSGIFWETALQTTGYVRAEVYVDPAAPDEERPMADLGIERCGAIHVTAGGWELRPLESGDEVWEFFQHLRWLYDVAGKDRPPWVGDAITPPEAELPPLDEYRPPVPPDDDLPF
jgi:hypothetical protein